MPHTNTLIYCHGLLGHKSEADFILDQLTSYDKILRFSFSGHGDSIDDRKWSIELFAKNLAEHIELHQPERYHIFGYSLGGYVALYAACQQWIKPEKLITLGTKWFWDMAFFEKESRKMNYSFLLDKAPTLIEKWANIHPTTPVEKMLDKALHFMEDMTLMPDWTERKISFIKCPVIILRGESDHFVAEDECLKMESLSPLISYGKISNLGHNLESLSHLEILEFLEEKNKSAE